MTKVHGGFPTKYGPKKNKKKTDALSSQKTPVRKTWPIKITKRNICIPILGHWSFVKIEYELFGVVGPYIEGKPLVYIFFTLVIQRTTLPCKNSACSSLKSFHQIKSMLLSPRSLEN